MKFAKKMKLVDIDDDISHTSIASTQQLLPTDDNFTAPRMLSILDNSMNSILNRHDIDDGEKWALYNQTLQRYLNYMKKQRTQNFNTQHTQNFNTQHIPQPEINVQNQLTHSFDGRISDNDISGISPMRDSLDSISNTRVRNFFEQARQSSQNSNATAQSSPISHNVSDISMPILNHSLQMPPQRSTTTKKRVTKKRPATAHPEGYMRPCKISLTDLAKSRGRTRSVTNFFWKATNAK